MVNCVFGKSTHRLVTDIVTASQFLKLCIFEPTIRLPPRSNIRDCQPGTVISGMLIVQFLLHQLGHTPVPKSHCSQTPCELGH